MVFKELQDAFRAPSSPYYLAPGEQGPASPEEVLVQAVDGSLPQPSTLTNTNSHLIGPEDVLTASEKLIRRGYHAGSIWEQKIVWGDHDSFQYVVLQLFLTYTSLYLWILTRVRKTRKQCSIW
jgi:hypothetical protein